MSASANKKLMQDIFAAAANPDPAARDRALFTASLADDARWVVTGQYSWSRTFTGKEAILNDLHGYVRTRLRDRTRTVAHRFIADGDVVVVEAKGDNVTTASRLSAGTCVRSTLRASCSNCSTGACAIWRDITSRFGCCALACR